MSFKDTLGTWYTHTVISFVHKGSTVCLLQAGKQHSWNFPDFSILSFDIVSVAYYILSKCIGYHFFNSYLGFLPSWSIKTFEAAFLVNVNHAHQWMFGQCLWQSHTSCSGQNDSQWQIHWLEISSTSLGEQHQDTDQYNQPGLKNENNCTLP